MCVPVCLCACVTVCVYTHACVSVYGLNNLPLLIPHRLSNKDRAIIHLPRNGPLHHILMEQTVKVEHLVAVINLLTAVAMQQAIVEAVDDRH